MVEAYLNMFPPTGVWWDLDSCPVPAGFDPGLVRPSIEWALNSFFGPRRVTVFAVGNLEDISPGLLKKISSSGILLRHTPRGGLEVCDLIEGEWKMNYPPPAPIMLISRDAPWFFSSFFSLGYKILRAYDGPPPQFPYSPSVMDWEWKTLLKEYSHFEITSDVKTNCQVLKDDFPTWSCVLCKITSESSFDDFIKHLKSEEHIQELFDSVPSYTKENYRPKHFCQICNYPTFDTYTLDIHCKSQVHAQNALEHSAALLQKVAPFGHLVQDSSAGPGPSELPPKQRLA